MRNDCWIDSAYYAMFAADTLRPFFAESLRKANSDTSPTLKDFAKNSYNYILGLNDAAWAGKCKQLCKSNITKNIVAYARELLAKSDKSLNTVVEADKAGLVIDKAGNGNASIILQFISRFDANIYYDTVGANLFDPECKYDKTLAKSARKPITKFLKDRIKAIGEIHNDVLIIPFL